MKPEPEVVNVSSEVRKLFPWIDEAALPLKEEAIHQLRIELRKIGRELTPRRLKIVSDTLEGYQQSILDLQKSHKKMVTALRGYFGHKRIQEVVGKLGKTLYKESFQIGLEDPDAIRKSDKLSREQRNRISKVVLAVDAAFAAASVEGGEELKKLLISSLKVTRCTLSVVPPSSRTKKAGEAKPAEADADE